MNKCDGKLSHLYVWFSISTKAICSVVSFSPIRSIIPLRHATDCDWRKSIKRIRAKIKNQNRARDVLWSIVYLGDKEREQKIVQKNLTNAKVE
jgi:hypothetical protein